MEPKLSAGRMQPARRHLAAAPVTLACLVALLACARLPAATEPPASGMDAGASAQRTLVLALYPYVPRFEQFESAIRKAWDALDTGAALEIVPRDQWDGGYSQDPSADFDVYVFDAMFLAYFEAQGWLSPLQPGEIQNLADFLPYAIGGVESRNAYLAIPLLGCANILFYREGDTALAAATTLGDVAQAVGECRYTSQVPPDPTGLMVDLAGGTTNASFYADAQYSVTHQFPIPLPPTPKDVDARALGNVRELLRMASFYNGTQDPSQQYARGAWFDQGHGRAVVGFTESLSAMPESRAEVEFKVLPLSDTPGRPLFYADVIGIHPSTQDRPLAVALANLVGSAAVVVASTGPDASGQAQYLMPTRPSVFQALAGDPVYARMWKLVSERSRVSLPWRPARASGCVP